MAYSEQIGEGKQNNCSKPTRCVVRCGQGQQIGVVLYVRSIDVKRGARLPVLQRFHHTNMGARLAQPVHPVFCQ